MKIRIEVKAGIPDDHDKKNKYGRSFAIKVKCCTIVCDCCLIRPSGRVRLKNANYAIFSGQIVRLERPIMR